MKKNSGVSLVSMMTIATLAWEEYGWWSPDGEFFGDGNHFAEVTRKHHGIKHDYRVSVFKRQSGNYDIEVELIFCQKVFNVAEQKGIESLECAYMDIVAAIADFESSNRFHEEIWSGLISAENRRHIFRQTPNGSVEWLASTYQPESVLGLDELMRNNDNFGLGEYLVWKDGGSCVSYQIHETFTLSKHVNDLPAEVMLKLESEVCVG